MNILFTICSNNYLAQAKTLGDSLATFNGNYRFVVVLCDKKSKEVDYTFLNGFELVEVSELGIEKFSEMVAQYGIIELNTSVKPFAFDYLYKKYADANIVMYLDPDTCAFDCFATIEQELETASILLTPHICTPIEFDGFEPTENAFTQFGVYNLGFLATKRSKSTDKMLQWWKKRLAVNCYNDPTKGIFVDQLPMNFAPIFFDEVRVSKNLGINMAPWNLHERTLTHQGGRYFVNKQDPLVLYHFSNCSMTNPDILSTYYTRVSFEGNSDLKMAYDNYRTLVLKNGYSTLCKIKCVYNNFAKQSNKHKGKKSTLSGVFKYLKKYPLFFLRKDFWIASK